MPSPTSASAFSTSRSAISSSASSSGASESEGERVTSCPAARRVPSIRLPNMRSGATAMIRATGRRLEAAAPAELLAHALGPPPHLDHLGAALANFAQAHLAGHALRVELCEDPLYGLRGGGVAEAVSDED